MKRFAALFIFAGGIRRMTFDAIDIKEAETIGLEWGVGVEGEADEIGPVKPIVPEAFNLEDTRRLLGGIGRTLVYEMLNDGRLERVPQVRRLLVTRKSIVRCANGQ
jgi:hypothetical protein